MADSLDIDFVRRQFPQLTNGWVHLDNAGGTLVPKSVIARMTAFMSESQVQPNGGYGPSILATERLAEAKAAMAALINAAPDEVVISHSTTMNVYVLANALRSRLVPGDEIIVTNLDHEANNGAWRRLADIGVVVREWTVDPDTADLAIADLKRLLTARTRLVAVTHCSNITGSINDVESIVRAAHGAGALVCVDGVAYAPHRRVDVKALDADIYLCSLYKIYGPHHALMYVRRDLMRTLPSQNHFFIGENRPPLTLNVGGYNYEMVASLTGIADYFKALHRHHAPGANAEFPDQLAFVYDLIARHEERIAAPLIEAFAAIPRIRLIGRPSADRHARVPTFSFTVEGMDSAEVAKQLNARRLGARSGHFFAYRIVEALGHLPRGGVVRTSLVHYNSADDVDRLVHTLGTLA